MDLNSHKAEVANRIRRSGLGCMVTFRQGGAITLIKFIHQGPINEELAAKTFPYPSWNIKESGKRYWVDRPDDLKAHYYLDVEPVLND